MSNYNKPISKKQIEQLKNCDLFMECLVLAKITDMDVLLLINYIFILWDLFIELMVMYSELLDNYLIY